MKAAILRLAEQAKRADAEGLRQDRREMLCGQGQKGCVIFGRQVARQGQMKAALFHDVGIAVKIEQLALTWCQTFGPAASNLGLVQGRAQRVKLGHNPRRQIAKGGLIALGYQRQEPFQVQHLQTWHRDSGKRLGHLRHGCQQVIDTGPLHQPEGRLDRAMKAVFARISRHSRQIKPQFGLNYSAPRGRIPAQPSGCGLGKGSLFGRVIDGVAFHLFHGAPPSVILSHLCDDPLAGLQDPLI